MRSRFPVILLALCFATSVAAQVAARTEPESKRVLLLYGGRYEFPAIRAVDTGLREAFAVRGGVEVFAEFFDFARFPAARHTDGLIALLRDRYGSQKLDMVITTGYEALQFALAQRTELFPGVPITYCHVEPHQLAGHALPPDVIGAVVFHDFRRTIELALKLQPGLREAVCVFGTTELDRQVGGEALAALTRYPELQVRSMETVPYAGIMEQVRHLPAESMVLYVNMQRDVAGQARLPSLVAEELSATSSVPVYGFVTHQLERGLLGGAMTDYEAHGRQIGALAVARLDGQTPAPPDAAASPLMINWGALKKWHVPESRVPAEAIVRFKPPSLWQEHRGMIIGIFAVVAMQSALIAGLLMNRATRRRAELALAESKERMSLAADAAQLGMWVWDVSADDAWVTERGRALFGFKPDAHLDYAAILDRVHPEDRGLRDDALKRALETQGEYEMEYRVQLPDGEVRWISARGRCVGTVDGKGQKLLGVSMDVTARRHAEAEAQQQRAELAHFSRVTMLGELSGSLAHELNQPLGIILSNAQAAQDLLRQNPPVVTEVDQILTDIVAANRRASAIIERLRALMKRGPEARQPLPLNELVGEVLRLVQADLIGRGVIPVCDLAPDLPFIIGDRVQLQQLVLNLVLNGADAMKANRPGSRRLQLTTRRHQQVVRVTVRDEGTGLPADNEQVFQPFFTTKSTGLGMGLTICRSIITAHRGRLWAEPHPEQGALFHFELPVSNSPIQP